ncbi:uncharacterized protein LOC133203344 [Saccostrea echinata]|uniref:uncharacterized protein LOC133203344 n=1 Tax=Saccostrea echinata TaxID=191078 RepID=UPI002A7FB401|nr:uncharacterized protein LOC133203344 [Saccostrea echinata]
MAEKRSPENQRCDEIIPKKRSRTSSGDLQTPKGHDPSTSTDKSLNSFVENDNESSNDLRDDYYDDQDYDYDDYNEDDADEEENDDSDDGDDDDYLGNNSEFENDFNNDELYDHDDDDNEGDDDDDDDDDDDGDNEEDYNGRSLREHVRNNSEFDNDVDYHLLEHNDEDYDYDNDDDDDDDDNNNMYMEEYYDRRPVDPLSDLTTDQYAVLYTLLLCCDMYGWISMVSDASMGDIDVTKTVKELESEELVKCDSNSNRVRISEDKRIQLMRSYREKCLLSDIDIDFFTKVASGFSLYIYADAYIFNEDVSRKPLDSCPIALMRLIVQAQTEIDFHILHTGIFPPVCRESGILEKVRHFLLSWCRLRKIVDPIRWTDMCPNERIKSVYSASTVCSLPNRETKSVFLTPSKTAILCTILMTENYEVSTKTIEEKIQEVVKVFPTLCHDDLDTFRDTLEEMEKCDKTVKMEKENIGFASENVRHQVMSYFVMDCLRTDNDYENYIKLSSVDSLLEYVRTWRFCKGENERCIYLPEKLEDAFIKALGLNAILHVLVVKKNYFEEEVAEEIRKKVMSNVNVPEEILDWDYDARYRYVECAKKGTQSTHRARAMIVGCAGAGKTTLLKRLQKKSLAELRILRSTVGLEVHEDIFEVSQDEDSLRALAAETNKEGKQLLSVMDFGGQCAYYACHQVYLSRRAFYLLVIDMSKPFKEKIDKKCCDQEGTMFGDWTYGEYLLFWMKSIHLYSAADAPVILVGTHLDKAKGQTSDTLYRSILDHLRYDENLKRHLNRKRCFVLGFQEKGEQCLDKLSDLEKCIVSIAKEERWKETIPRDWAMCEVVLVELKSTEKMLSCKEVSRKFLNYIEEKETNVQDVLKLFHEIGLILHFNEECLSETVVIDIQWFVDAFKNIITDPNHVLDLVKSDAEWMDFDQNGYLSHQLLKKNMGIRRIANRA